MITDLYRMRDITLITNGLNIVQLVKDSNSLQLGRPEASSGSDDYNIVDQGFIYSAQVLVFSGPSPDISRLTSYVLFGLTFMTL